MTRTRLLAAGAVLLAPALGLMAGGLTPPAPPAVAVYSPQPPGAPLQPPGAPPKGSGLKGPGLPWLGGAGGQPKGMPGRPNIQLRLGQQPQRTPVQEAGWWADKVLSDLAQMKEDVAGSRLGVFARGALNQHADAAVGQAVAVEKVLGQNNRNQWHRAYDDLDKAMADLGRAVAQHARNNRRIELSLARAEYAAEQLGAAISAADAGNQNQLRRAIVHMAASLERQGEWLRGSVEALPGGAPALEREARQFARAAGKFHANLAGGGNLDQARRDLTALGNQWNDLSAALDRFPNLPAPIRFQATRVDGLYRRLCDLLGVTPPAPPVPPPAPPKVSVLAVGAGAGMNPRVVVIGDDQGTVVNSFIAYDKVAHRSGVRVAVADLTGDGMPEVVTINGGQGHARVKVFDGRDASLLLQFDGFDQNVTPYGYFVAAADVTRDGRALVAIAADAGGPPDVEVYDLAAGRLVGTVRPFPRTFDGGVRLAFGDVNGDGTPDLISASGPGKIASTVKVHDGTNLNLVLGDYLGAAPNFTGGLYVAAADLTRNNRAEIVVGLDAGPSPSVRIFSGQNGKFIGEIEPYPNTFRGGVRVAVGDPDDKSRMKVICAPGPGGRDLPVKVFTLDGKLHSRFDPFPQSESGAYIGSR